MSTAEYVRELLLTSPYFEEVSELDMHISFVGDRPTEYSIDPIPTQPIVKQYLNGGTIRRFSFALTARVGIIDDQVRAEGLNQYDKLTLWFERQSRIHALPAMADGAQAQKIATIGNVFLMERDDDNSSGLYQMECELTYYLKGDF